MSKFWILCLCAVLSAVGCSATADPVSVRVTPKTSELKAIVEGLATSGQIGSGAQELTDKFEELKKSDAAKAEAVKADFEKLLSADGKPDQVKQLAKALAAKL